MGAENTALWPALALLGIDDEGDNDEADAETLAGVGVGEGSVVKPDAVDDEAGAVVVVGSAVERVPMVTVAMTVLGGAARREDGTGMVDVAEGSGESNEPFMLSMLRRGSYVSSGRVRGRGGGLLSVREGGGERLIWTAPVGCEVEGCEANVTGRETWASAHYHGQDHALCVRNGSGRRIGLHPTGRNKHIVQGQNGARNTHRERKAMHFGHIHRFDLLNELLDQGHTLGIYI
jgi:hypothetical protein